MSTITTPAIRKARDTGYLVSSRTAQFEQAAWMQIALVSPALKL